MDTSNNAKGAEIDLIAQKREQDALVEAAYQNYISGDLQAYFVGGDKDRVPPIISGSYTENKIGEYNISVYSSAANSGYSMRLSGLASGTQTAFSSQPGPLGNDGLYLQFSNAENYGNTNWVVPVPNTRSATYITRKKAYENALATRERVLSGAETNLNQATGPDVFRQHNKSSG